tara:strand:- start:879 stop:1529 length:651 start_codon:yes stop_codon:yes gene_type:complete
MNTIVERSNKIKSYISNQNNSKKINIIAVSKTFDLEYIKPLVDFGHIHFGENKVQEAEKKWKSFLATKKEIKLHMVGKLQSNKAKKAVELFHYVHSLDNEKLAETLSKAEDHFKKRLYYFIQVNVGTENQKSGIDPNQINEFYNYCTKEKNLNVIGLMAIPPNDGKEEKHFKFLNESNISLGLKDLSIGMSGDYKKALVFNATFLRIGTAIFGERT